MTPNFVLTFPLAVAGSDVMEELTEITLAELCRACNTQADIIIELVNEGAMTGVSMQADQGSTQWRFNGIHLRQAKIATRLQRDLGVNLAGAALALQLMDEIDNLRQQMSHIAR